MGEDGNNTPAIKRFLFEVKPGKVPQTIWEYDEVGHTQDAKKELIHWEFPRLCRGGSRSLTFPGVRLGRAAGPGPAGRIRTAGCWLTVGRRGRI